MLKYIFKIFDDTKVRWPFGLWWYTQWLSTSEFQYNIIYTVYSIMYYIYSIIYIINCIMIIYGGLWFKNHFFTPTAIHGCAGIVFILAGRVGVRMVRQVAAATLSGLDLCDHKLEEVQTWQTCSYHGLVVQCHGQTLVQPLTLTLWPWT